VIVAGAALLTAGAAVAHASSLGGVSSTRLTSAFVAGAPAVIVYGCDDFTGTNGTSLVGRAATAAAPCNNRSWSVPLGSWVIQTNAAQSTGIMIGLSGGTAVMNTSTGPTVSVRAGVSATGLGLLTAAGGVVASYTNSTTFLRAQIERGVLVGLLGDSVRLFLGSTQLASVPYTIVGGSTPQLRLTRNGTSVSVRVDAAVMINATLTGAESAALSGGQAGIYFFGANGIRIDDFAVTGADP
jgi:hypothetical protein